MRKEWREEKRKKKGRKVTDWNKNRKKKEKIFIEIYKETEGKYNWEKEIKRKKNVYFFKNTDNAAQE